MQSPLLYFLLALISCVQSHVKDRECFHNKTTTIKSRQYVVFDVKHTYINSGGIEHVRKQERITLKSGENTTISLYAAGYSKFNPRELFVSNSAGEMSAAIGTMYYFYNSELVESNIEWDCWKTTTNTGSTYFSTNQEYRHGKFSYLRDRVEVKKVDDDIVLGDDQDRQCYDMIKPEDVGEIIADNEVVLNLTLTKSTSSTGGSWTYVTDNHTVILRENERREVQAKYDTHNVGEYGDHNPRNISLLYHGGRLYVGMAHQKEYDFYWSGSWSHEIKWTCNETSLVIPESDQETHELNYYVFRQYASTLFVFEHCLQVSVLSGAHGNLFLNSYILLLMPVMMVHFYSYM